MFHTHQVAKGSFLKTSSFGKEKEFQIESCKGQAFWYASDSTVALWKSRLVWWSSTSHILCLIEVWKYQYLSTCTLNHWTLTVFFEVFRWDLWFTCLLDWNVTITVASTWFEAKQLGIDDVDIDDLGGQGQMCPGNFRAYEGTVDGNQKSGGFTSWGR